MALSKTTRDHDEIRKWAESRGAVPSEVASTHSGNEAGILRLHFPKTGQQNDESLQEISWEDFFAKFDEDKLELVYQEKAADGEQSNFNKLVHPDDNSRTDRQVSKTGSRVRATKKATAKGAGKSAKKSAANSASKSTDGKAAAKGSGRAASRSAKKTTASKTKATKNTRRNSVKKSSAKSSSTRAKSATSRSKSAAKSSGKAAKAAGRGAKQSGGRSAQKKRATR